MFSLSPEVRKKYLNRRQTDIVSLNEALAGNNLDYISKVGHDWKGNGETYGFPEFSRWGKSLEDAAIAKNVDVIRNVLSEVAQFLDNNN